MLREAPPAFEPGHAEPKADTDHAFELDLASCTLRRDDGSAVMLSCEEVALLIHMARQPLRPLGMLELRSVLDAYCPDCSLPRLNANLYRLRQKLIMFDGGLQLLPGRRMSYYYSGPRIRTSHRSLRFGNLLDDRGEADDQSAWNSAQMCQHTAASTSRKHFLRVQRPATKA